MPLTKQWLSGIIHMDNIVSKPNFTAWFVLQGTIAAMHQPYAHGADTKLPFKYYEALSRTAADTRLISRVITALPYWLQYRIGEFVTNKGRLRHYYLRKKTIAVWVRNLLVHNDIRQMVILGAGLDALPMQLAEEFPDLKCIEIDVKESQHFKCLAFEKAGIAIPENIEYLSADLRNPLNQVLESSKIFSSERKTLWLAEGFFMFLTETEVSRLFSEIKTLSTAGSQMVFTTLPVLNQGTFLSKMIQNCYLKREKSPMLWLIKRDKIPLFADKTGYIHRQTMAYEELPESHNLPKFDNVKQVGEDIHRIEVLE